MDRETGTPRADHPLLRRRDGHEAPVRPTELFFDLVYVFAITRLSHALLHHLTPMGALEVAVLWFAVWLGWQYTAWTTNWFEPDTRAIRLLLFAIMAAALVMSAAIPQAFGARGLVFALAYVTIQVGRTLFHVLTLPRDHPLAANFRRMLGWLLISACFWVAGGVSADHGARLGLWAVAVGIEYFSPMIGFRLPFLGRSTTAEWTIDGHHLAERCQLFVIVALGETILATGVRLAEADGWSGSVIAAFAIAFVGSLSLWWIYFGTSSRDGAHLIAHAEDPGRVGAYFHYVHAILVGEIIVIAVAHDLVIEHPHGRPTPAMLGVMLGGPAIFLAASGVFKRIVYACWPVSHIVGIVAFGGIALVGGLSDVIWVAMLAVGVLLAVGATDSWLVDRRGTRA